MARYHINPKTGNPGICRAVKSCPYGDLLTDHFDNKEAAQVEYEDRMESSELATHTKTLKLQTPEMNFSEATDSMTFEAVEEYANMSSQNHELIDRVIDARAAEALAASIRLDELNPFKNKESTCDKATYKKLKKDFDEYKNKTAALVEAHLESRFYTPDYVEMKKTSFVGKAKEITSFDPSSAEWLRARFDSVGGSDVGSLAVMDFTDENKIMYWDRSSIKKIEESKLALPSEEEIANRNYASFESRSGPLYRGTAWEDRSRDRFVADNPEYTVYNTKSQYAHPDRPWQQVNFDGVLSDRNDGEPNGILELKTGNDPHKWTDGPPLNYRAQVLYYLNATGFDYAKIGVNINDGEYKYYTINKNDPVCPGKYDGTMEDYINERVTPWFDELKSQRAA